MLIYPLVCVAHLFFRAKFVLKDAHEHKFSPEKPLLLPVAGNIVETILFQKAQYSYFSHSENLFAESVVCYTVSVVRLPPFFELCRSPVAMSPEGVLHHASVKHD